MNNKDDLLTRISKWLMPSLFLSPGASRSCEETMQRAFGREPDDIWLDDVQSATMLNNAFGGQVKRLKFVLKGKVPSCGDRGRFVCHIADGTLYTWGKVASIGREPGGMYSFVAEVPSAPTLIQHESHGGCYWKSGPGMHNPDGTLRTCEVAE